MPTCREDMFRAVASVRLNNPFNVCTTRLPCAPVFAQVLSGGFTSASETLVDACAATLELYMCEEGEEMHKTSSSYSGKHLLYQFHGPGGTNAGQERIIKAITTAGQTNNFFVPLTPLANDIWPHLRA